MLTMQFILSRTPQQRILDAGLVKILKRKAGYLDNGDVFFAAQTKSVRERLPNGNIVRATGKPVYLTMIIVLNRRGHVKVSCSCADFMYRMEYPLTQKQAGDIEYSNGDPTRITNPTLIPMICKHLVKLHQAIQPQLSRIIKG